MKLKNGKKGSLLLTYVVALFIVVLIIIIFVIFAFQISISSKILTIRKDLFYISQNCFMAFDKTALEYNEYIMDNTKMKEIVSDIIFKNYDGTVTLKDVSYDKNTNEVKISVNIKISPIIKTNYINEVIVPLEEKYKLKLMEGK